MTDSPQHPPYLLSLRDHLRSLPPAQREQLLHQVHAQVSSALAGESFMAAAPTELHPPQALPYAWHSTLSPQRPGANVRPLLGPLRAAATGITGAVVFLVALFGYSLGAGLVLTAFLKSFFPRHVGAWMGNGGLWNIGFTTAPPSSAHELLGPHYLTAALPAGAALLAGTYLLIRLIMAGSTRLRLCLAATPSAG